MASAHEDHNESDATGEEKRTDCVVGRAWCPGPESEALPCISCWLRRDRDDDPHPEVAAVADAGSKRDHGGNASDTRRAGQEPNEPPTGSDPD